MAGVAAVRAEGIAKRYGRHSGWVLRDLDISVEPGSLIEVAGANGSGKSTLLRILAGVARPTHGRVTERPAQVGYVPERLPAHIRMNGRSYLMHMAAVRGVGRDGAERRAETLARAIGLQPGLGTPIMELSKGNRQKICLLQALLAPAGMLVLDEPWSGLDPGAAAGLTEALDQALRAGAAVIASSHRAGNVARADRTLRLVGGHLETALRDDAGRAAGSRTAWRRPCAGSDIGPKGMAFEGPVTVELLAPTALADGAQLPEWAHAEVAEHSGRNWRLVLGRSSVDRLLANALAAGWSVRRVGPLPTEIPHDMRDEL